MKNSKTKKSLSLFLTLTMLISSLLFTIPASAEIASSNIYKASDYFTLENVTSGPWTNQFYDFDGTGTEASKYVDMAYTKEDVFGTDLDAWINHPVLSANGGADSGYTWGNNSVAVGATKMQADLSNSGNFLTSEKWGGIGRDYPVKTFTAPKSGTIEISAATVLTATTNGTDIRIMKIASGSDTPTLVWPAGDWVHISGEYTFPQFTIDVNVGDKLMFENAYKYSSSLNNTAYDTALDWNPCVEYVELNGAYVSSAYFNGMNPNGPWNWQYYDFITAGDRNKVSGYTNLSGGKMRTELDGSPIVWVSTMANDSYSWGNNAPYVGAEVMRASVATGTDTYNSYYENYGWTGRNYAVKTFTAPEKGILKISASTALTATANGTHIRITKFKDTDTNPTNVWPSGDNAWQHISGNYTFSDIEIDVEAGEKVAFENAYIKNADLNNTAADTVLYWDPVVEYIIPDTYKASDYFTLENVTSGPWTNQFYDFDGTGTEASKYVDMAYTKEDVFGTDLDAWINHPVLSANGGADSGYTWGNNSVAVGATKMQADLSNSGNFLTSEKWGGIGRDYPVKTFTAPKSGTIEISAATVLTATTKGTDIRIVKIESGSDSPALVWPVEGWKHIKGEYTFADKVVIPVNAGDKITFENAYKYSSSLGNTAYDTELAWDPYVEYVDLNGVYASSTYFNAMNPNGPWGLQYYDVMTAGLDDGGVTKVSGYVDMVAGKVIDGNSVLVSTPVTAAGDYSWGDKAAYVGATAMRTATAETNWVTYNSSFENLGWVGRNYPVKTFTAPKSGVIKISAATALTATANGTHIRITKFKDTDANPTNVWPKANNAWQHISGSYTFSDIEIEVEAGEKITFENAYIKDAALSNTAADTVLYWDPVVEYADLPYVSSIEFTNASGTKLNSFDEIVSAGTVNVTAVLGCAGLNGVEEVTVLVAIYDTDKMEAVGLSSTKAIPGGDSETFTFSVENIPSLYSGRIKVFIWDNMTSLTPLSDIGGIDYITAD